MSGALVVRADGGLVPVSLKPGVSHLALMREQLGCHLVFCVSLTSRLDMWLDEDGATTGPVNLPVTRLAHRFGQSWRTCYGPALLCAASGQRSPSLTTEQIIALLHPLADSI